MREGLTTVMIHWHPSSISNVVGAINFWSSNKIQREYDFIGVQHMAFAAKHYHTNCPADHFARKSFDQSSIFGSAVDASSSCVAAFCAPGRFNRWCPISSHCLMMSAVASG